MKLLVYAPACFSANAPITGIMNRLPWNAWIIAISQRTKNPMPNDRYQNTR